MTGFIESKPQANIQKWGSVNRGRQGVVQCCGMLRHRINERQT